MTRGRPRGVGDPGDPGGYFAFVCRTCYNPTPLGPGASLVDRPTCRFCGGEVTLGVVEDRPD